MTLSRRKALSLIGGGTIFAATAGVAGFAMTRTPKGALISWRQAGHYEDPRESALSFALLARSPHNLQPWSVQLEGVDSLSLYHDMDRRLPATDPYDRQITIGLGCFLEQMVLAAGAGGHKVDVSLYPQGPAGPVAHAVFTPGADADPLAAHMMARGSCKQPFEDRPIPEALASELGQIADIYTDAAEVKALKDLTVQAWLVEGLTPHTMQESVDLMRMGKAEINASPDGIGLGGAFLEGLMAVGMLDRAALSDQSSSSFQLAMETYLAMLDATPAFAVLTSQGNSREDQINAGRRWLRLNLMTTAMGLSLHPVSQTLQEYPEMAEHYAKAHQLLAQNGQTVQMLGRLGYGPETPRTPRWPLEAKLHRAKL